MFARLQTLLPQHGLSRLSGLLTDSRTPWLKNTLIRLAIRQFKINMSEADRSNPEDYVTFNDFFTRQLKPDARTFALHSRRWVSPADGEISQIGEIEHGTLLQAKGKIFSLRALLGSEEQAAKYTKGSFATIYLSPSDYHRVHMPSFGQLNSMRHIPGKLFSVNQSTAAAIDSLFARNERVVCEFDSPQGSFIMILVGAMIVGSIHTRWHGQVTPLSRQAQTWQYPTPSDLLQLNQGQEMGHFQMGSTVILLSSNKNLSWSKALIPGAKVKVGETIAQLLD